MDRIPLQNFSKEERKDSSRNLDSQNASPDGFEPETLGSIVQRGTTEPTTAAASLKSLLFIAITLLMYTVASPDPNSRGGGQLSNLNECNSTLTSGTRGYLPLPIYR